MPSSTGPVMGFSTVPIYDSANYFSDLAAGEREVTAVICPPQTESLLLALPVEILFYLIQKIDDLVSPLALSHTCSQFRAIYQDEKLYTLPERQSHLLIYNLTTPLLRNKLYATLLNKDVLKMTPPDLHTPQWHQLRDYPLVKGLVRQQYQTALIQKTYITAWDLVLHPTVLDNAPLASELMRVLGELLPYVKGARVYAQKLFGLGFPQDIFIKLMNRNVD